MNATSPCRSISVFSVGSPEDFPPGSRRLLQRERVLIVRDERGFRALSAVCTHLGCAPQAAFEVGAAELSARVGREWPGGFLKVDPPVFSRIG